VETQKSVTVLSLFTSASTLICCALPALLVTLGGGAALVSVLGAVPQLVWLSERKEALFIAAAVMLLAAGWLQWRARFAPCPIEPELARQCMRTRQQSLRVYFASVGMTIIGAVFAFVLPWWNAQAG
jgi:hypothetical protein